MDLSSELKFPDLCGIAESKVEISSISLSISQVYRVGDSVANVTLNDILSDILENLRQNLIVVHYTIAKAIDNRQLTQQVRIHIVCSSTPIV